MGRWVSVWIIYVMRIVLCCCGVSVTHCCQQLRIKPDANLTTSSRVSPSATIYTHKRDRDKAATVTERDGTLSDIKITNIFLSVCLIMYIGEFFSSGPDIHSLSTDYCHLCVCDTERVNVCMRSCFVCGASRPWFVKAPPHSWFYMDSFWDSPF